MRRLGGNWPRWLIAGACLGSACGSGPGGPNLSPSPSPSPQAGGPVTGRYLLQITPGPSCPVPRGTLSFPMQAASAGQAPHPGVQVLILGDGSRLELEFLSTTVELRGGLGTTADGVLANEGLRAWVNAIGTGPVRRAADGRGEVLTGTLAGYLALAPANGDVGDLGECSATDHAFALRGQ
jgi:hypothetical protein